MLYIIHGFTQSLYNKKNKEGKIKENKLSIYLTYWQINLEKKNYKTKSNKLIVIAYWAFTI